ncbi:MAG: translation elongation factor 4 [Patescibacteria group bacterium]|nr:translation elongation factor 4 [Patescibacteria group bacterium]
MNQEHIRNFCIIAHIDHGKSTLADRFLELTGTVEKRRMHEQYLDTMELEQERGITIKLQPVRMRYTLAGQDYILNLIDTPGHVDFTYEVSRALAACEGAVLLVDATQGIQAQTLANLHLAQAQNLVIIPAINKVDLVNAEPERVAEEISTLLNFPRQDILMLSAKTGNGVEALLAAVIKHFPSPQGREGAPGRALVFDSSYDTHRGVVAYVRVVDGEFLVQAPIRLLGAKSETHILELGHFLPNFQKAKTLRVGEVGYLVTDFREVSKVKVGDTIAGASGTVEPLPGYREVKPMVYASFFPENGGDYPKLRDAIGKLKLSDAALTYEPVTVPAIGTGFRCGFLGLLHLDIVQERLFRASNLDMVVTAPTVEYRVKLRAGQELAVHSAAELPDPSHIETMFEPWANVEVMTPAKFLGGILELLTARRGLQKNVEYLSEHRVLVSFEIPLANLIVDFYDKLKSTSSGYASMNYEFLEFRSSELVKLEILVAGERVEAFSNIVFRPDAERFGREILFKLKSLIPRHQFAIALQAAIGGSIVARETISPFRKDVTAGLYGGDDSRKRKVLEKQKKGKKRLKQFGRVSIPAETFIEVFKR